MTESKPRFEYIEAHNVPGVLDTERDTVAGLITRDTARNTVTELNSNPAAVALFLAAGAWQTRSSFDDHAAGIASGPFGFLFHDEEVAAPAAEAATK